MFLLKNVSIYSHRQFHNDPLPSHVIAGARSNGGGQQLQLRGGRRQKGEQVHEDRLGS